MRVEDYPRPKNDNRRGMHWAQMASYPRGDRLDFWVHQLQDMQIKWVKLVDDGAGSSLAVCRRLLADGMMPIVCLARSAERQPGSLTADQIETVRRLVGEGVRYVETDSEPDLRIAWRASRPDNWLDTVVDEFISGAERILAMGGLPALPAMSAGCQADPVAKLVERGRTDLFDAGAWVAVHAYTLNRPLSYPFDDVNRAGQALSEQEYQAQGPWAWQERPRDVINQWRAEGRQAEPTLAAAGPCFLSWRGLDRQIQSALGHAVPILATEAGPVVGWQDDRRYPRITPEAHVTMVAGIDAFLQGRSSLGGEACPSHFFAVCYTLLANQRLGNELPEWEAAAWYGDRWNAEFGLKGALPAVQLLRPTPGSAPAASSAAVQAPAQPATGPTPATAPTPPASAGGALPGRLAAALAAAAAALGGMGQAVTTALGGKAPPAPLSPVADVAEEAEVAEPIPTVAEPVPTAAQPPVTRSGELTTQGRPPVPEPEPVPEAVPESSTADAARPAGFGGLSGKVSDHQGAPAAGVRVALRRGAETLEETVTTAEGTFAFAGLPLGSYAVGVQNVTVAGLALDGASTRGIRLNLGTPGPGPARVDGVIPGAHPGQRIRLEGVAGWQEAGLDAGSAFCFTDLGTGRYRLVLDGVGLIAGDIYLEPGGLYKLVYPMRSRIHGRFADAQPGWVAVLHSPPEWGWTRQCPLDDHGAYAFEGLPPGTYQLQAGRHLIQDIELNGENVAELTPPESHPGRSAIVGRVCDASGQPQAGVPLVLRCGDLFVASASTGDDGAYHFRHLPAGAYTLEAESAGQGPCELNLDGETPIHYSFQIALSGQESEQEAGPAAEGEPAPAGPTAPPDIETTPVETPVTRGAGAATPAFVVRAALAPEGSDFDGTAPAAGSDGHQAAPAGAEPAPPAPPPSPAPRFMAHYLLFAPLASSAALSEQHRAESRLALALAIEYLRRTGATGGFNVEEAKQAARVTIVGDSVPVEADAVLGQAGCHVTRLPGDGYALAQGFARLLSALGEG